MWSQMAKVRRAGSNSTSGDKVEADDGAVGDGAVTLAPAVNDGTEEDEADDGGGGGSTRAGFFWRLVSPVRRVSIKRTAAV